MNRNQWEIFIKFKEEFKKKVAEWQEKAPELAQLQREAVEKSKSPLYSFETAVVYNKALDEITEQDNIKLIVIGDNPGKDEQLAKNNKYLVGQAGKIAEGYFRRNPELKIDFRKNVIILNKTPVHSGKTNQLKTIIKNGGKKINDLIEESEQWMAEKTASLHSDLCRAGKEQGETACIPELWLVGYAELKDKGIFTKYRDYLKETYFKYYKETWENVYVFQHFSMNRFTIDLNDYVKKNKLERNPLINNIHQIGSCHKSEIFENNKNS